MLARAPARIPKGLTWIRRCSRKLVSTFADYERLRPCGQGAALLVSQLYFHRIGIIKAQGVVEALGALGSKPRLAIYRLLVRRGPEGYTPAELVTRLDLPTPTFSFHLKELLWSKLTLSRREGRNLYYSPSFERMSALVAFLTENSRVRRAKVFPSPGRICV